jgi:L-galactose dehydrogenase
VHYRKFGKTGLEVSVIAFGASPLGNVFGDMDASASSRVVGAAVDRGINLFDVSPYYGMTLAEERLGQALQPYRAQVLLATKCGRYGSNDFDFSAPTIVREFDESLRRLRTDHVDLLQAHDIEFAGIRQILDETLPAMERLKEQGKVRFIGVTGYWPGLLARVASEAYLDCVLNYCHSNLFVDDIDAELAPTAERIGIGLLNASPMHMGLLGERPIPAWHPASKPVRNAALKVRQACEHHGVNPGTLALHACLNHRIVAATLVGLSNEEEVAAACAALDWTPPSDLLNEVRDILEPVHNCVWSSGLPENHDVPISAMRRCDASR